MCLVLPCFTSPRSKQGGGLLSTTLLFPRACIDSACIGPLPTLGCLQRLMAVKLTSPNGRVLRLLQKKITTMLTIADNAHVFLGQKSSFFRQKIHLHARGPHHLFPDEFHQISSPMLCSPVHRGEAVLIPHLRAVRRSSCITHSSVASEIPSFRYLRLTN